MSKNVALIEEGLVVNVAVFDDEWEGDEWDGRTAVSVPDSVDVGPGWLYDGGAFYLPPQHTLVVWPSEIDMSETALASYTNTEEESPEIVIFNVNGEEATVSLTDGVAELEITPSAIGSIVVSVNQEVPSVTIVAKEG